MILARSVQKPSMLIFVIRSVWGSWSECKSTVSIWHAFRQSDSDDVLADLTFVITGTLPGMGRKEAAELIERHGGKVSSSVSKKTNCLLAGENAGSKLDKANALGVTVLTEEELIRNASRVKPMRIEIERGGNPMPIKTQSDLPAKAILEHENIFVMDEERALHQDIRPIEIGILNLMPLKEDTELQMLRSLSNSPLQVDITFLAVESHISKNTSVSHLNKFYQTFRDIKDRNLDGLIITGAPVELHDFEEVDYWDELVEIMEWSKTHVTCTFYQCWGAQAGLVLSLRNQEGECLDQKDFWSLRAQGSKTARSRWYADLMIISWHHIPDTPEWTRRPSETTRT